MKIFTKQGYHGTSMREIAEASSFSIGNLYNHYATKEILFETLVKKYEERFGELRAKALAELDDAFTPERLHRLAASIKEIVCKNPDDCSGSSGGGGRRSNDPALHARILGRQKGERQHRAVRVMARTVWRHLRDRP